MQLASTEDASIGAENQLLRDFHQQLNAGSSRPRVAMISTHGYVAAEPCMGAADTGGQVAYVLELSKKLALLGYEADIWTRCFEDQPEIEPVADHVRIIRARCGGANFIPKEYLYEHLPQWNKNALALIRKHGLRYSLINSHYWDAGIAGQALADELGVPHIHTPHSIGLWKKRRMETDFPGGQEHLEAKYNFTQRIRHESQIYDRADVVIATTPQQLDVLTREHQAPPAKCRTIPPGYEESRFYPIGEASREAIRKRLGFEGPVVMAIGRIARNKGYDLLIEAFSLVAQRDPKATLFLAIGGTVRTPGENELLAELKSLAKNLQLENRVRFSGFIPDAEMADYYHAADVFVLSSRYEPFGMTAIEAMACGTPTVITVHGGLYGALTFGQHTLYADPFDKEDLGIMILKVLKHARLRRRLSLKGAEKARGLFTWTGVARKLVCQVETV